MNSFADVIGKIGIFMIAGQALVHFAPGQKYEKYIKLIVGMMVLLQFLSFIYGITGRTDVDFGEMISEAEEEFEKDMEEKMKKGIMPESEEDFYKSLADGNDLLSMRVTKGMEEEIKSKLNNEINGEGYSVWKVNVELDTEVGNSVGYGGYDNGSYNSNGYNSSEYNNTSYVESASIKVQVYVRKYEDSGEYENLYGTEDDSAPKSPAVDPGEDDTAIKIDKISVRKIDAGKNDNEADEQEESPAKDNLSASEDMQELSALFRRRFCAVLGIGEECMEVSVNG